jgi:6-phosphogluconolactonase (cycloisomerase 2 family)
MRRSWSTRVGRSTVQGLLLAGLLSLAGASSALAGIPYTFTPVAGSPFSAGGTLVVFSPNGAYLADSDGGRIWLQTVSGAAVGPPVLSAGAGSCSPPARYYQDQIDSIAYSRNGALLAEAEDPGTGVTDGSLRIYSASGTTLTNDSCRALPFVGPHTTFSKPPQRIYSLAFGPNGLLAVTNERNNTVSVYSVTGAGKTRPVSGSPFSTGKDPDAVAFGPTASGGEALATANWGDNNVSTFSVSSGVVAPAAGSPFATLAGPVSVAFSPTGGLLAVADSNANEVNMYKVSFAGGLTGVAAAHTGGDPQSAAFSPSGGLLATANYADNNVSLFSVASTGQLAQVSDSPFSPGVGPVSIAFDKDGFLLATANDIPYTGFLNGKTAVYSYGQSLLVKLPPWLSARLGQIMWSLGLRRDRTPIKAAIGKALEQIDWGDGRTIGTVHLVSTRRLASGRTINVRMLVFRAHSVIHTVQIIRRHKLLPGSHTLVVTATAPGVRSRPRSLRVRVVG